MKVEESRRIAFGLFIWLFGGRVDASRPRAPLVKKRGATAVAGPVSTRGAPAAH